MPEIIRKVDLVDISGRSFINYAMSVIVDRALPDVRDGLKPVHRRILYALDELGFVVEKPHKKSVTTVGHVLGRYHPHGDSSAYNAMVTLIQPFTSRYPLVDGHGNFGSTDGDSPAAMRYTEARFSRIGQAMTENIHKDTIDFIPNFDNNHKEPKVLPTLIPNLLANGTTGIAVGMATNLAPHNLTELYDALDYIILQTLEGEEIDEMKIMDYVKAPDFPTGGQIVGLEGVKKAFLTGSGKIIVRGKYSVIEESGKTSIVITEIPYRVNKARLVEKIDSLMKTGIINGIRELRDDSDKEGTSIFIELKRDAQPQLIINKLLKHTELQTTFNVNNTVLVETSNGSLRPQVVSLKEALMHFLTHAATVIIRRSAYDCQRATERLNLVRGQLLALDHLDEVIAIIRGSEDPVAELLNSEYGFNKEQAEAVVEMRLKALTNASLTKLTTEATTLEDSIQYLTSIVEDDAVLLNTMRKEFETLKKKFGDERRTEIVLDDSEIEESDLVEDEMLIVTYSSDGLLKAVEEKEYRTQNRGTKGSKGITTKDDEIIKYLLTVNSKEDLLFFTNQGRCHMLKAYNIGKTSRTARGKSINNYLKLMPDEFVITMISTDSKNKDNHLLFVTHNGIIKRLALENLSTRHSVTKVVEFKEGDSLVSVAIIDDSSQVLLTTALGQAVRISMSPDVSKSVRAMGRAAAGVIGIKLKSKDYVVDMAVVQDDSTILTITENGLGKRTKLSEYQVQARGGSGILTHKLGPKTGPIVAALVVNDSDELFIATNQGLVVRIDVDSISTLSRNTAGVKVINLNEGDKVASVSKGNEEDIETETASEVS